MKRFSLIRGFVLCAIFLIAGCSGGEKIPLQGERLSVLELQESLTADNADKMQAIELPDAWKNEFWPQAGGYPNHAMQHLSLGDPLAQVWKAKIGTGGNRDIPLMAQPIVVNGMVITMDAKAVVKAFDITDGTQLWEQRAAHKEEDDPVITGGLAYGDQRIFITNGYNEILALDYKTGGLLWRQPLPGPSQVAPTVLDGRVYVLTIDNVLRAFAVEDGASLWDYAAVSEGTGVVGGASPAASREVVISAFSSGEIAALRVENGALAWSENLDTVGRFGGLGSILDIKALPVIDKGLLIVMNYGGRMAAVDLRSGSRIWQRDVGGANVPWVAGDVIFVLSSDNRLMAMDRKTGLIHWIKNLPSYRDPEDRDDPIHWQGPVLAGGRLILVSSYGQVVEISPETSDVLTSWDIGRDVSIAPIVAGDTLYIVSDRGVLYAYR